MLSVNKKPGVVSILDKYTGIVIEIETKYLRHGLHCLRCASEIRYHAKYLHIVESLHNSGTYEDIQIAVMLGKYKG